MNLRKALIAAAACLATSATSAAGPSVEIANQAGPHGTAPREWLQRLAKAGAGPTRLVASGRDAQPRMENLGELPDGSPIVKLFGVLTRRGELLLPGPTGPQTFRAGDTVKLAEYFTRLDGDGAEAVTEQRGKFGLTRAEFVDLFTRLQTPLDAYDAAPTLSRLIQDASRATRVTIAIDPAAERAVATESEAADEVAGLASGAALAAALRAEGLALAVERPIGGVAQLRVVPAKDAQEPWPIGYEPEVPIARAAPILVEQLTVEVEGYNLAEAIDAVRPRLEWKGAPLVVAYDRFALRAAAIDPAAIDVSFPRRKTHYKRLLDTLASQARLGVMVRVDEAGTPFLWITK